jgi:hypothetical protein
MMTDIGIHESCTNKMEDLKKIQEFFSKPLNEVSGNIDSEDFAKVVQAISQTDHPVTVMLTPMFGKNEIEILIGMDAPDPIGDAMFNIMTDLGYRRGDFSIVGDTSTYSRREYSDIRRVNGGHRDYQRWEESVNEAEYTDYSNKELAAYCKNNPTDKKAAKELHKRSQALKNLSRTDEGGVAGWKKASMSMIKHIQTQLDDMGVKYEMGDTPYAPFKTIYKPINKSDNWYDKFDDLIWRANLRGVVKTSMNEAFGEKYYVRVRLKDASEAMKAFDDFIGKNDFSVNKEGDQFSTDDVKAGIKLYRHLTDRLVKVYDHNLPLEDKNLPVYEAEEDKIDIVAMDVPLFIRALEYAREDAQADMDLHDFAEKAIAGTKEAGVLTMDDYDMLVGEKESVDEAELTEAYVPSNIAEFAKRRGISSLVRKVAGWAEKVGARITGGTAIGKGYNTLILDLGYQTADIRIDVEEETIELYDEPIYSFNDFKRVFMEEVTRSQAEHDEEQLRRERGLEESEYSPMGYAKKVAKGEMSMDDARDESGIPYHELKDLIGKIVSELKEDRPGLWANIHAQRERGEKPARKGSKAYKDAVKAGKKINKEK